MALTDFLSGIADAIRTKDGTSELIPATDFQQRILNIPSGGVDIDDIILGEITIPQAQYEVEINVDIPDDYAMLGFFFFSKTFFKNYLVTGIDPKEYGYKTVGGCYFTNCDNSITPLSRTFITHLKDGFEDPLYSVRSHSIDNDAHTMTWNSRSSNNYQIIGDYMYIMFVGKIPIESVV